MWDLAIFAAILVYLIAVAPMIGGPIAYAVVFMALVAWLGFRAVRMVRGR